MPKWIADSSMDLLLAVIDGATVMHACTTLDATPTLAEVNAASLANVAMAAGDITLADGATSGRRAIMAAKSGVSVTATNTAADIALVDGTNVKCVTTCTPQALTSGGTVNFPTWSWEVRDPT